jgi:CRP-like cAMP-binding protein
LRTEAKDKPVDSSIDNLFLLSLSDESREFLLARTTPVPLPLKTSLYEAEETPPYAYFLTSGIASVVTTMADGGTAEVGLIGREGIVGSFHLLGPAPVSTHCFIQLEATALRIPLIELKKAFRSSEEIRERILEFVQEQALGVSQLAGCQRLHEAEQRLARWLLMAQDRTQSEQLNFTQEFLAMMLGAQRTTVTMVAGSLQRAGLIEYQRGKVKILNREELEAAACDCYKITKHLYANLYKQNQPDSR